MLQHVIVMGLLVVFVAIGNGEPTVEIQSRCQDQFERNQREVVYNEMQGFCIDSIGNNFNYFGLWGTMDVLPRYDCTRICDSDPACVGISYQTMHPDSSVFIRCYLHFSDDAELSLVRDWDAERRYSSAGIGAISRGDGTSGIWCFPQSHLRLELTDVKARIDTCENNYEGIQAQGSARFREA